MFLSKKKGATPTDTRADLQGLDKIHGGTGQKVLAIMVAIAASVIILGFVAYRYVYPVISSKETQIPSAVKETAEVKPPAELKVPLDIDNAASPELAVSGTESPSDTRASDYRPLPGLAGDARPSPAPGQRGSARPIGAAPPLPPGMQNPAMSADQSGNQAYPQDGQTRYTGQGQSPIADRKLEGDLGDFGEKPSPGGLRAAAVADRREQIPECAGLEGGPEVEAECMRRMPKLQRTAFNPQQAIGGMPPMPAAAPQGGGPLSNQLNAIATPNGSVGRVPNPHLTLRKGEVITCTLDTAIASEQAGFVECVTDFPIYSMNGKVLLAERGTRIVGEYSRDVAPGSKSIFVLWTRGETPAPHHVTFDLLSPGSDRLGRSGIQGDVDNKYWERYSGPLMFSLLQDVSTALTSRAAGNGTQQNNGVFLLPSTQNAGQNAVAELLKQGGEVKRSLYRNQGDTISITVARYIDFSPIYKLRTAKGRN